MDCDLKYGELASDRDFVNNCEILKDNLQGIQQALNRLLPLKQQYEKLTVPARIELDLFLAYALNSLQWVYLRLQGEDPTKHPVKGELQRLKHVMKKWQEVKNSGKRPTVDVDAAKRFIKHGLYDPNKAIDEPPNKKVKN